MSPLFDYLRFVTIQGRLIIIELADPDHVDDRPLAEAIMHATRRGCFVAIYVRFNMRQKKRISVAVRTEGLLTLVQRGVDTLGNPALYRSFHNPRAVWEEPSLASPSCILTIDDTDRRTELTRVRIDSVFARRPATMHVDTSSHDICYWRTLATLANQLSEFPNVLPDNNPDVVSY